MNSKSQIKSQKKFLNLPIVHAYITQYYTSSLNIILLILLPTTCHIDCDNCTFISQFTIQFSKVQIQSIILQLSKYPYIYNTSNLTKPASLFHFKITLPYGSLVSLITLLEQFPISESKH